MKIGDKWYRFADYFTPNWEKYELVCHEYVVIKVNPKTVVLIDASYRCYLYGPNRECPDWIKQHTVLKDAHKRFAYPTKTLALQSYRIRKMREQQILEARLDRCKASRATASLMAGLLELPTSRRNM